MCSSIVCPGTGGVLAWRRPRRRRRDDAVTARFAANIMLPFCILIHVLMGIGGYADPAYLPASLLTCLNVLSATFACLPTYLHAYLPLYLPAYLPTLPTFLTHLTA